MRSIDERLNSLLQRKPARKRKKPARYRPKRGETAVDITKLQQLNETELVTIAREAGYESASRQLLREDLIDLILGERDVPSDPLEGPRRKIYSYVKGNERIMPSQMPCDLHCPTCPHHQVVECFTVNRDMVE
jgi:hypothetical protein